MMRLEGEAVSDKKEKSVNRREFLGILGSTSIGAAAMGVAVTRPSDADIKALEERVAVLEAMILDNSFKAALLQVAQKVAYIDAGGPEYYQELYNSMYRNRSLLSISAVLSLGDHTVKQDDDLETLRPYLTVTARFSDDETETVAKYTLNGSLAPGDNTITISYHQKTTTVQVTAVKLIASKYTELAYIETNGKQFIDTGLSAASPAVAEYEISYSKIASKGGHILSSDETFFPFFKESGKSKIVHASYWSNTKLSSGKNAFEWELGKRYVIRAFPEITINKHSVCTVKRGKKPGSENFFLFTYAKNPSSTDYRFRGKLYYAKIYDENNKLLRYFIPCRDEYGVAGLYDTVSHSFFTSNTSTALTAGEVV